MPKRALTAAAVDKLKPPASGQTDHFDGSHPGLALRISYGGRKSWTYHYRLYGKQRRLTLGTYPAMTLSEARDAWRAAWQAKERGEDPAAEKQEAKRKEPDTVEAVGRNFIERYCRPRNRTADEVARMFEIYVYPSIGAKPVEAVTRRDILRLLDKAEENGATVRANRVLSNLRRFFNWCLERGLIEASPVTNIKPPAKETPRERVLSDDELRAFLSACEALGDPFGRVMLLLLLTGQRRDEVAAARWSEFDMSSNTWTLPGERVKNGRAHVLPLSGQVRTIIDGITKEKGAVFLFPARFSRTGNSAPRHVSGFTRAKERLDSLMLAEMKKTAAERGDDPDSVILEPWRLHDLRRTAASGMARMGVGIHVVEKILNHVTGSLSGVAGIYNRHNYQDEMRQALQAWANWVDSLKQEEENVVRLAAVAR